MRLQVFFPGIFDSGFESENQDFVTEYIVNMEYGEAKVTKNTGSGSGSNGEKSS